MFRWKLWYAHSRNAVSSRQSTEDDVSAVPLQGRHAMNRRRATTLAAIVGVVGAASSAHSQGALISNGTVQLGVNNAGALNLPSAAGAPGYGGVGVRFLANGWDGTYAGCTCEGWGAGISGGAFNGVWGGQNTAVG